MKSLTTSADSFPMLANSLLGHNLGAASIEIFLTAAACLILLADLFIKPARRDWTLWLCIGTLILCGLMALAHVNVGLGASTAFFGHYISDDLANVLKACVAFGTVILLVYSRDFLRDRGLYRGELLALALFAVLGMFIMISGTNFLTLYIGLELQALCLYAMVALDRENPTATEAAMKYFVLGAIASGLLLYGMSMIYGATGTLNVFELGQRLGKGGANSTLLMLGTVFIVSGIAFKLGAVPYHMWVPDVYQGSSTPVVLFIGSIAKLAAFAFVVRILVVALQPLAFDWSMMLAILAALSMVLGNLVAIAQTNFKRMLAYSAIAQMGFMLLGFVAAKPEGYAAAMFYVITYALTTLASFGLILLMARRGFEADQLDVFKGLNQRSPTFAFLTLVVMFSLAGIPLTVGFIGKLSVIQAVVDAGYVWLAVVAVLTSLVGAFYYLRVVRLMYFDAPTDTTPIAPADGAYGLLIANALALILVGVLPQRVLALCAAAFGR